MYASDLVGTIHVLLAAAEVTPVEMHGYDAMTPRCISKVLEDLCVENAASEVTDLDLPNQLSPSAQELVMRALEFALITNRAMTLRDVWVALSNERGLVRMVFEQLGVDRTE